MIINKLTIKEKISQKMMILLVLVVFYYNYTNI